MAIKNKLQGTAHKVTEKVKGIGHKIARGAETAAHWTKEHVGSPKEVRKAQNTADIREHMPVIASCGKRVGTVDHLEGDSIKLTRDTPAAHGEHRYIPLEWVQRVGDQVCLCKNSEQVEHEWGAAPLGARR